MKKIEVPPLELDKEIIASLDLQQLNAIMGGYYDQNSSITCHGVSVCDTNDNSTAGCTSGTSSCGV